VDGRRAESHRRHGTTPARGNVFDRLGRRRRAHAIEVALGQLDEQLTDRIDRRLGIGLELGDGRVGPRIVSTRTVGQRRRGGGDGAIEVRRTGMGSGCGRRLDGELEAANTDRGGSEDGVRIGSGRIE
jgi:hypothetical protein